MTGRPEISEADPGVGRAADLRAQIEQLRAELDAAQAEIGRLHQDTHRWWSAADQYRHELLAVYASLSWQITAPLRQANLALRRLLAAGRGAAQRLWHLPRRAAKAVVLWSIRQVLGSPRLKAQAERALAAHPRLRQRLRGLVLAAPNQAVEAPAPEYPGAADERLARLSARAASVYDELQQALAVREPR